MIPVLKTSEIAICAKNQHLRRIIMEKSKRHISILVAALCGCTIVCTSAFATTYQSSLSISSNSSYTGNTRQYDGENYYVMITPDSFTGNATSSSVNVSVCSTSIKLGDTYWSTETLAGPKRLSLPKVGQSEGTYIGNAGAGKRAYSFSTRSSSNPNGNPGFNASVMYMYN